MRACCKYLLPTMVRKLSVALIQLQVGTSKATNIQRVVAKILEATSKTRVDLVALPECFNSPYGIEYFKEYAEPIPGGETCKMLSQEAKKNDVFIVGGTIPEKDGDKIYNTCTVWNPEGNLIGKYRKMHLFDIDIPGKMTFQESKVLAAGNELCVFEAKQIKIGVGICYDLRFHQLATIYRQMGCDVLIYPAAFNMTTGPLHWEILQRGRAIDNQVFVMTISPARNEKGYIAWGYSQITNPWGKFKALTCEEDILYDELNMVECANFREQIPIFNQRREDIYETKLTEKKIRLITSY